MVTMRSAPAQAKPATNGSSTGAIATAAANAGANGYASANPPDRAVDSDAPPEPRRYTQEMMLQLFKPQDLTHDFVASEHVFSGPSLPPVSLTALTAKEQELLAGSINSGPSKRYNANNQQQHQHQHQQHYSRGNAASLQRSGSYGPMTTAARAKYKDEHSHAAAGLDNDPAADAEESLWAHQSLARDSVGSFGADGVFRMGAANDDDALEGPVSRSSTRGDALRDPDGFTSRSGSPATASSRIGAAAGLLSRTHSHSHSHSRAHQRLSDTRSPHASSALDVGASAVTWNDLATRPPGFLQQQQQQTQNRLVKRAELVKWWYRDPQGNIQGPFSVANMQDWYSGDYFPTDLHVCHEGGPGFEPLGSLVARIGDDQNVFLYASLAFIAQGLQQRGSGISTPATLGTISRAASAVQVATLSTEVASVVAPAVAPTMPNIGIGALSGGSQGSPATGIDGTLASLTASSGADLQQTGSLPVAEQPGTA
ncbi:kinesin-like protein, partial [Coemansia sp. RSA 2703]